MSLAVAPTVAKRFSPHLLAGVLGGAGALHVAAPAFFEAIMPRALPRPRAWVYGSGVVELACAAGLLGRRTRRVGGVASAVLLTAVFPANVQMALDSGGGKPGLTANPVVAWGRLPLQVPLVLWALDIAKRAPRA